MVELRDFDTVWEAVRADAPEARVLRRRLGAGTAFVGFVLLLLVALGLAALVVTLLVTLLALALVVLAVLTVRRHRLLFAARGRAGAAAVRRAAHRCRPAAQRAASAAARLSASALEDARTRAARLPELQDRRRELVRLDAAGARLRRARSSVAAATARALAGTRARTSRLPELRDRLPRPAPPATATTPPAHDRLREAVRLNTEGTRLRRAGAFAEAAEHHRQALGVFDELGDRRAAALTLNNLALALDRAGDESALELFEQAATTLGALGDEQGEGQVIANLAVALRRRGNGERSAEVLDLALTKLDANSSEYRKVEELRRAS